jgi:protein ImuA
VTVRTEIIAELRKRLQAAEAPRGRTVSLGVAEIDQALADGGLRMGALHEVCGAAATGFTLALMSGLEGELLWCAGGRGAGGLYPPGLARFQVSTGSFTLARAARRRDALWVVEEALRSGACAGVALEADFALAVTESRRLQLAAEEGGSLGLVLRPHGVATAGTASVARTRWLAEPHPGATGALMRWRLELVRNRGGAAGAWEVAWHEASHRLQAVSGPPPLAEREAFAGVA